MIITLLYALNRNEFNNDSSFCIKEYEKVDNNLVRIDK